MWAVGEGNFSGKKSFEVHTIPESVDDNLLLCPVLEMSFLLAVGLSFAFFFVRPFLSTRILLSGTVRYLMPPRNELQSRQLAI